MKYIQHTYNFKRDFRDVISMTIFLIFLRFANLEIKLFNVKMWYKMGKIHMFEIFPNCAQLLYE